MSSAAFFRLEGTLLDRPPLHAAAYLAASSQTFGERIARLGNVALAAPLSLTGELSAGATAARMTWMGVRGMTEDRLVILSEEYYERYIKDDLLETGLYLLEKSKSEGRRIVLISDSIDLIVQPLADALGVDDLVCNRLEMRKAKATGRLEEPVIGGNVAGQWARAFAAEQKIDLAHSLAYGASAADSLLLSAIGKPCAVNPDRQLRRIARDHDWPVVER